MSISACQNGAVDQAFAIFLNPIKDLAQNWEIDIAKMLDEYLEKIEGIEKKMTSRSSDLSFTEAAIVIQGSVNIYCKKVEYFEKIILQVLSDLGSGSSNSNLANMNMNERLNDIRKGRVKKIDILSLDEMEFKNVNNITKGKNIELVENEEVNSSKKNNSEFLPANSYQLCEKSEKYCSNEIELLERGEYIGAKGDFYLNSCYLMPSGCLSINPPIDSLRNILPQNSETNGSDNLVIQDYNESFSDPVGEKNGLGNTSQNLPEAIDPTSNLDIGEMQNCDEAELQPEIPKDINKNLPIEMDVITTIKLPNGRRSTLRKRSRRSPWQSPPWHQVDAHSCPLPDRPIRSGKMRRLIPCRCHTIRKRKRYNPKLYLKDKVLSKSGLMPVDDFISISLHNFKNTKNLKVPPEIIEEANNERKKRDNILNARKASLAETNGIEEQDISVLREELNNGLNEIIEDDYDSLILDDVHHPDTSFCDAANLVLDPAVPPDRVQPQEGDTDLAFAPITQEEWDLIGDHLYQPCTIYEAILQRKMAYFMLGAQKVLASNELLQRVNRWKSNIMPKLEMDEKRKHFDIHAYGNEILSKFSEIGETLNFEEISRNYPQKDVSRVFLSCLMLGNSYNVKLFSSGGILSMDDLQLTLLSKVQQHEHMEEYAAPSQQQTPAYQNNTASVVVDRVTSKKKPLTSDSGFCSAMEESSVLSRFSTLEDSIAHGSRTAPIAGASGCMVKHNRTNKKRQLTIDSGMCSVMEEGSAPSRLSTLEVGTATLEEGTATLEEGAATLEVCTAQEFLQPGSPKRKRTESILMQSKGSKKKKVTFDPSTFLSTLGGSSFSFSNI